MKEPQESEEHYKDEWLRLLKESNFTNRVHCLGLWIIALILLFKDCIR